VGICGGDGISCARSGDCVALLLVFGDAIGGRGFYVDAVSGTDADLNSF